MRLAELCQTYSKIVNGVNSNLENSILLIRGSIIKMKTALY